MKRLIGILAVMLALSAGGCAEFGFNPTGYWQFSEENTYVDNDLKGAIHAADDKRYADIFMVFEKSGTGYLNAGGTKMEQFTYSYDSKTVTVVYLPNEHHSDSVTVKFAVADNTLVRTETSEEGGVAYREEFIYTRA